LKQKSFDCRDKVRPEAAHAHLPETNFRTLIQPLDLAINSHNGNGSRVGGNGNETAGPLSQQQQIPENPNTKCDKLQSRGPICATWVTLTVKGAMDPTVALRENMLLILIFIGHL